MALLFVKTDLPCIVTLASYIKEVSENKEAAFICEDEGTAIIKCCYCGGCGKYADDIAAEYSLDLHTCIIRFSEGKPIWSVGCTVTDWGCCCRATVKIPKSKQCCPAPPAMLSELTKCFGNRYSKISLYRDNGIRLIAEVSKTGEQLSYYVSDGENGDLGTFEIGGKSFVFIKLMGERHNDNLICRRLLLIDSTLNTVLDISGDACDIDNGKPASIDRLDLPEGFEIKRRYDKIQGNWQEISNETGFYTRSMRELTDNSEKALAFALSIKHGMYSNARRYLCGELSECLSDSLLSEHLGAFDAAEICPDIFNCQNEDTVRIGLIDRLQNTASSAAERPFSACKDVLTPRICLFGFEEGMISDIEMQ